MEGYRAAGSGLGGQDLRGRGAGGAGGGLARSGREHAQSVCTSSAGAHARWGRCASTCMGSPIQATLARCCVRPTPSAPRAWRSAPTAPTRRSPKAVRASMGAIFRWRWLARSRSRATGRAHRAACPTPATAPAATRRTPGRHAAGRGRARGAAERARSRVRAGRAHPVAGRLAERRDGRDRRAV